jgi:glutamate synthase (NADPH/NADH) small chain
VFAAGDCTFERGRGEAMVVEAAEQGKIAAASVDRHLRQAQKV